MPYLVLRSSRIDLTGYSLGNHAAGYTYTCPRCGEQWGKLVMEGSGCWLTSSHPCEDHGSPLGRGGSVLHRVRWGNYTNPDTWRIIETLPLGLLRHECLMLANQILKG